MRDSKRKALKRAGTRLVDDKSGDGVAHLFRFVVPDRVTAVLEDAQIRSRDQPVDFFGEFRCANPVVPSGEDQRGRGDGFKLRAQIVVLQETARREGAVDGIRRQDAAVATWLGRGWVGL